MTWLLGILAGVLWCAGGYGLACDIRRWLHHHEPELLWKDDSDLARSA